MIVVDVITIILLSSGLVFLVGATVGVLRLPDCYTRAHAAGMCDSLGAQLCFFGVAVYALGHAGISGASVTLFLKVILIAVFLLVTSPTAGHATFRAAHEAGIRPWMKKDDRAPRHAERPGGEKAKDSGEKTS